MKIIAISGSLRERSSNGALLRAAARVAPDGVEVLGYDGVRDLPHFNPDLDVEGSEPPGHVRKLRELLGGADGVLVSCPEYAHGVPGSFKNMLDWLVSTGELVDKPVALLNAAPSGGQYAQNAIIETLRTMNWRFVEQASLIEPFLKQKLNGELTDEAMLLIVRNAMSKFVSVLVQAQND